MPESDEALFRNWMSGDALAFDEIYARYATQVFSFLRYLGAPPDAADSLAQETFFRLIRSADRFDPDRRLNLWLFRIARNVWIDRVRGNRRESVAQQKITDEPQERDDAPPPERKVEGDEEFARVLSALDRLDEPQREVIAMRFLQGLGAKEIAGVLELPAATVRTRIHRGMERLRKLLDA